MTEILGNTESLLKLLNVEIPIEHIYETVKKDSKDISYRLFKGEPELQYLIHSISPRKLNQSYGIEIHDAASNTFYKLNGEDLFDIFEFAFREQFDSSQRKDFISKINMLIGILSESPIEDISGPYKNLYTQINKYLGQESLNQSYTANFLIDADIPSIFDALRNPSSYDETGILPKIGNDQTFILGSENQDDGTMILGGPED